MDQNSFLKMMSSASTNNFQPYQDYHQDFLSFSPYIDTSARERLFPEVEEASDNSKASSENEDFTPLDLTVKSPRNSPSPDESFHEKKRKFDSSDSDEEFDNKRQKSLPQASQLPPLSIIPPTPNPYMNPDLLSPLSLAPVPTPFMSLYNIGSPAPPTSLAGSSSSMNLTPPQTPQGTSFPSLLPFQMPPTSSSQMPDMPYPLSMQMQMPYYFNQMSNNPYSPQMLQSQHPSIAMETKTLSPPSTNFDQQNQAKKVRKILPKPTTPPLMQRNDGSPPLHQRSQEFPENVNNLTPPLPLTAQTMTINNQTIHINPLPSSSPPITPTTSMSNPTQMHMTTPQSMSTAMPPQMSLYPQQPYPGYLPYPNPYQQQFMPRPEPKPMSQALSFLFEKSLGSVKRWRENGVTIQVFYCAVCQMPTDNEERMRTHIEAYHGELATLSPSANGVYQCKDCDQVCVDEASLARHKLIHVNASPKEKCKGCGRSFATQEILENHEKDCSLYRPYR